MTKKNKIIKPLESWETVNLRLSIFLTTAIDISKHISWRNIFNTQPDTHNSQPKIGISEESGELDNGQIVLKLSPGRVDLIYQRNITDMQLLEFPKLSLGKASVTTVSFSYKAKELIEKLKLLPDIQVKRLAFGADLHMQMPDKKTAYSTLGDFLHSVKVDVTTSDLEYNINRRRTSKINNIEVNRLCFWRPIQYQIVINGHDLSNSISYACQLVLDINTVPTEEPLLLKKLEEEFDELLQMGIEIAERGDIP